MSEESSDDIPVEVVKRQVVTYKPDWNELPKKVNCILFKSFAGRPISFHCKIDGSALKRKYESLILSYGGVAMDEYIDMDNSTALMVDDNTKVILFDRPSFKVSYIFDCIKSNALLDISKYLHNPYTFKSGNYMNILFWETEKFLNETLVPYRDSSSSSEEEKDKKCDKHTRDMYSRNEKEAILKFLLARKNLTGLRGTLIWKKMEKRGICPKRTYQSMRNHFLKTLLFELDKFTFLSKKDKKALIAQ